MRHRLQQFVDIKDHTAPDDDVSFRYFLYGKEDGILIAQIRLSMVGRYALLEREDKVRTVIWNGAETVPTSTEKLVMNLIENAGLHFLIRLHLK